MKVQHFFFSLFFAVLFMPNNANSTLNECDDLLSTDEDTSVVINVLENDQDGAIRGIGIVEFSTPEQGILEMYGFSIRYTPFENYNGNDSFTYRANAASLNPGRFNDTEQILGNYNSLDVGLGDLDSDGDLDAFVANYDNSNQVFLNNGYGIFTNTEQILGNNTSRDISLGDLDGDEDVDAMVANNDSGNQVWLNDGFGNFSEGQSLETIHSTSVSLGDLDNDGDLDTFISYGDSENQVWFNNGTGNFINSQSLGNNENSHSAALGDLDGDGDLDVFLANEEDDQIWMNDGTGIFTDSGQRLNVQQSLDVKLGDLDRDGDLDALVTNNYNSTYVYCYEDCLCHTKDIYNCCFEVCYDEPITCVEHQVWKNNGSGIFTRNANLNLNSTCSYETSAWFGSTSLGDLNGNGYLDIFSVTDRYNQIWLNDSSGNFREDTQELGSRNINNAGLGDLDGNGSLDIFEAKRRSNKVLLNEGNLFEYEATVNIVVEPVNDIPISQKDKVITDEDFSIIRNST